MNLEVRRAEYESAPAIGFCLVDVVSILGRWYALSHVVMRAQPLQESRLRFVDEATCNVDLAADVLAGLRRLYGERATMGWEAARLVRLLGEIEADYRALAPLERTQPGDDQDPQAQLAFSEGD